MTIFNVATGLLQVLMLVAVCWLIPVRTRLQVLADNELKHIRTDIQAVNDAVLRVEQKLDEHIRWHLEHTT